MWVSINVGVCVTGFTLRLTERRTTLMTYAAFVPLDPGSGNYQRGKADSIRVSTVGHVLRLITEVDVQCKQVRNGSADSSDSLFDFILYHVFM